MKSGLVQTIWHGYSPLYFSFLLAAHINQSPGELCVGTGVQGFYPQCLFLEFPFKMEVCLLEGVIIFSYRSSHPPHFLPTPPSHPTPKIMASLLFCAEILGETMVGGGKGWTLVHGEHYTPQVLHWHSFIRSGIWQSLFQQFPNFLGKVESWLLSSLGSPLGNFIHRRDLVWGCRLWWEGWTGHRRMENL